MTETTWVFAAGMRRSASTLQYLLAKELVELAGGHAAGWVIHQKFDETYQALDGEYPFVILKTHAFTPQFSVTADILFERQRAVALTIFRDPRDVAASLLKINRTPQPWEDVMVNMPVVLQEFLLWSSVYAESALIQTYETSPIHLLKEMAAFLGIATTLDWQNDCAERHSLEAHKELIDNFDGKYDRVNLLWYNHIDKGEIGRYKEELAPEQLVQIEAFYEEWKAKR